MTQRLEQLKKLHAADPADPFCTYGIALEIAKTGQVDEALSWLDKTLELDPHYCYAYFQKGKILSGVGRSSEARTVLTDAIKLARNIPNNPEAAHAAEEMAALLDSIED
jgi:tetratricopeptide (TPR) repeat protein